MAEPKPENTNATLKGLRPGHLYQVEVCAQNKEGVGPPLRTKDPIKAENPYGKYFKSKSLDKILGDKDQKMTLRRKPNDNWILFPEPPSPPKEPYITDFDNKSVTLRWGKPQNDGGRPISHYVVQV